jgi:3-hydroxyisobutyrate dehydrogenase
LLQDVAMQVGFVGLGVMGFPMAGHLAAAGHEVRVYNRSPNKAETWATRYPGTSAATLEHLAEGCQLIGLCVGRDSDVRDIVPALLSHMAKGGVIVDHTTTSAHLARDMAEIAAQAGIHFLDAPVSGGQAGAESGQLTIMVGGSETGFAKAEPVIQAYAKAIRRMGPSGAGQQAKMANQICIAGVVQGLAEAVHFCRQSGLDAVKARPNPGR